MAPLMPSARYQFRRDGWRRAADSFHGASLNRKSGAMRQSPPPRALAALRGLGNILGGLDAARRWPRMSGACVKSTRISFLEKIEGLVRIWFGSRDGRGT